MKNFLIATKNRDKYQIVSALIAKAVPEDVSFHILKDIDIEITEEGSILERAEQKARTYWEYLDKAERDKYTAVIGVDDGFSLSSEGAGDPNSKDLTDKILSGAFIKEGETIWIKRGFALYNNDGLKSCLTAIPFIFLGNPLNILRQEGVYPLSSVLGLVGRDIPVKDADFNDTISYYLKYCGDDLKRLFKI
jgi:hypothetical protein